MLNYLRLMNLKLLQKKAIQKEVHEVLQRNIKKDNKIVEWYYKSTIQSKTWQK